jgi:hypothetical protein
MTIVLDCRINALERTEYRLGLHLSAAIEIVSERAGV